MPRESIKAALEQAINENPAKFSELMGTALKLKTAEMLEKKKEEVSANMLAVSESEEELEETPEGEKKFIGKHPVQKTGHPVAKDNQFKSDIAPKKAKRKADNMKDGEKEDPTDTGEKLKKVDLSGKSGG